MSFFEATLNVYAKRLIKVSFFVASQNVYAKRLIKVPFFVAPLNVRAKRFIKNIYISAKKKLYAHYHFFGFKYALNYYSVFFFKKIKYHFLCLTITK